MNNHRVYPRWHRVGGLIVCALLAYSSKDVYASEEDVAAMHTADADSRPNVKMVQAPQSSTSWLDPDADDPLKWLDAREGHRAMQWVRSENARTRAQLMKDSRYEAFYRLALNAARREGQSSIPGSLLNSMHSEWVYALRQSKAHPKGLWQRSSRSDFRSGSNSWETLLDVDALARKENRDWQMFGAGTGAACLATTYQRCMLWLEEAGKGDGKRTWREFDVSKKSFVPNGFVVPLAQGTNVSWKDADTLLVNDERNIREWHRGHLLATEPAIPGSAHLFILNLDGQEKYRQRYAIASVAQGQALWVRSGDSPYVATHLPPFGFAALSRGQFVFATTADWSDRDIKWPSGSLLSVPLAGITDKQPRVQAVLNAEQGAVDELRSVEDGILLIEYRAAVPDVLRLIYDSGGWNVLKLNLPDGGVIKPVYTDATGAFAYLRVESVIEPPTLYEVNVRTSNVSRLRSEPTKFDTSKFLLERAWATSTDGTRIPYLVVRNKTSSFNGFNPTILHAYGSFGVGDYALFSESLARLWLDRGGVYVVANVRGGNELGQAWHDVTVKTNRQRTYDDFFAVAKDLVGRGITSTTKLGIQGLSAGGELMGVAITQRPHMFAAAVLESAPLDLLKISVSLRNEWGSPFDPTERATLERTSPYANVKRNTLEFAPLILQAADDDRVPPGQARRFVAKLQSLGIAALYLETPDGGHFLRDTPELQAQEEALMFIYLSQRLMDSRAASR